jgi:hypothetical protein
MTLTIPNTGLSLHIGFDSVNTTVGTSVPPAAGTFYIDSVSFVYGTNAPTFIPLNAAVDLLRCQRFFFRIGGGVFYIGMGQATSASQMNFRYQWPVIMRAIPVITVNAVTSWMVFNATSTSLPTTNLIFNNAQMDNSLFVATVSTGLVAGNAATIYANSTSAYIDVSADF